MSMLKKEDRIQFINDTIKKIEINKFEIENQLKDEFIDLDYFQNELLKRTLSELNSLQDYLKKLKVDNDG